MLFKNRIKGGIKMAGLFALSVNPKIYKDNFLEALFWGTFYQQHLGEDYAGLSSYNQEREGKIMVRTHRGLFRPVFSEDLEGLEGTEGIGYCGVAREPFLVDSRLGRISICFSGNIINRPKLVEQFKNSGHTLERGDDIEILAKLIAQGDNVIDGIKRMTNEIRGAYSLLILTEEGIYVARCPSAHWPLVIGKREGAVVLASGSGGFNNLGFKLQRDLKPGEIVLIKNGQWETKEIITGDRIQFCSFVWVYTGFPNEIFEGIPTSLVRKRLGAFRARQDIERGFIPDIILPVPDSGRFHAIGYHQEFCRQMNEGKIKRIPFYDETLLKYPYAGRSFTPQTQEERNREAQIKLLEGGEDYRDKIAVICDDSIVRGTQTKTNLVPKLRKIGIKEIYFRISNPELRSYCPWGKTVQKGETMASQIPLKEDRIKFLGIESLEYNTIEELVGAIGLPREKLCVDCSLALSD